VTLPYVIPPAGMYPASFFVPGVSIIGPTSPPAVLADNIGADGEIASLFSLINPIDAAIRDAFRLQRGTGMAVQDAGQRFRDIRKNTADAPRKLLDEAQQLLDLFVKRGDIEILELQVDADLAPDLGALYIRYRNLRTQQEERFPP
jgi:hypothetical protein